MATRYEMVYELYTDTIKNITSPEKWRSFLRSACRNYKLKFDEQILVFAQRPDATAVLQMDRWNDCFGRWVNVGASGITVFADREATELTRYFDISDTHPGKNARPVPVWQMQDEYTVDILNSLNSTFDVNCNLIPQALTEIAEKIVNEAVKDHISDIIWGVKDSFLDELDELNLSVIFKKLAANSVAYMAMARLGLDPDNYFSDDVFDSITDFNTANALNALGIITRDSAVREISVISRTIMSKNRDKVLALNRESEYDIGNEETERSYNDERDSLQGRERLHDTRSEAAGAAGVQSGTLRQSAPEISEGGTSDNLYLPDDQWRADGTPSRGGYEGGRTGGTPHEADDGAGRCDRAVESRRYDELGSESEQYQKQSTGDSQRTSDLQHLNEELEYYDWENEDKSLPFFGRDDDINEMLLSTHGLTVSRDTINEFINTKPDHEDLTKYIKNIFNSGKTEIELHDGRTVGYKKMVNVLHLWEGHYDNRTAQSFYHWGVIASHFKSLNLMEKLKENAELDSPAFSFTTKIMDAVLCRGSGISEGKMRIYAQFSKSLSSKENVDFLKNEYGWGGSCPVLTGTGINELHDGKGIHLQVGFNDDAPHIDLSWTQAEKHISELIKNDEYLNKKEKSAYPEWLNAQEQRMAELESKSYGIIQQANISAQPTNSGNTEPMDSLEGHSMTEFEDFVIEKAQAIAEELGENTHIKIIGARVYGSRSRNNLSRADSDVDVVLSYDGDIPEDGFFNILNEHSLSLYGLKIDVNPISVAKTGTLEDYMDAANAYLDENKWQVERYEYHIGDTVYIGTGKFEITDIDNDKIQLADSNFPMLSREMSKSEFDKKNDENPMNSFLKVKVPEEPAAPEVPEDPVSREVPEEPVTSETLEEQAAPEAQEEKEQKKALDELNTSILQNDVMTLPKMYEYNKNCTPDFNSVEVEDSAALLAKDLDKFHYDNDPFGYDDEVDSSAESISEMQLDIETHHTKWIHDWLSGVIDDEDDGYEEAQKLIERLEKLEALYPAPELHYEVVPNNFARTRCTSMLQSYILKNGKSIFRAVIGRGSTEDCECMLEKLNEGIMTEQEVRSFLHDENCKWYYYIISPAKLFEDDSNYIFSDYSKAIACFRELKTRCSYQNLVQNSQDDKLDFDIKFGIQREEPYSVAEVIKVREGQNYLIDDFLQMQELYSSPEIMEILRNINTDLGFDRVELHNRDENRNYLPPVDIPFAEWKNEYFEVSIKEKLTTDEKQLKEMGITFHLNAENNSLEISFPDKPSDAVRDILKDNKFRWHSEKKVWYGYGHRSEIAEKLVDVLEKETPLTAVTDDPLKRKDLAPELSDYWVVEFNETSEDIPNYEGEVLSEALLNKIYALDEETPKYKKFYFDHIVNGEKINHMRIDIGDGNEINKEEFAILFKSLGLELPSKEAKITVKDTVAPEFEKPANKIILGSDLHSEIPLSDRINFNLVANPVEEVGKKERFRRNLEAINVLKECEFENRLATHEEQIILSKYVGWGGMPEAFDKNNTSWANEYIELQIALDPEEYAAARESTLTAFFTPPEVITAVYGVMANLGFKAGNVLEPACGIGNFMGCLPESMSGSRLYGVELDKVSAKIAQQLYQKNTILAQGYEQTYLPDNFFDAVIGNVPFGDFKVADKKYDKNNFLIHDYFFAKSLDKLRPGGVIALITSKGTMDKENPSVRKYIAQRADLLGAIRLPNNAFKGNAGTEVVSDILILQKRDRIVDIEPDWVHLNTDENGRKMNSYFVEHPDMVLGRWETVSGRFGMEDTVVPFETATLSELLSHAIGNIKGEIVEWDFDDEDVKSDNAIPADPTVRNFSYGLVDDKIYYRENSKMIPVVLNKTEEKRVKGMIELRDCVRQLIDFQTEDYPDEDITRQQEKLNKLYDNYTGKYGLLNSRANKSAFSRDSSYPVLSALEVVNKDGELERKADMFTKRTISPHIPITSADTAVEAFAISMGEKAGVDMDYMCELTGKTEGEIYKDLKGVIFLNPKFDNYHPKYLPADEYLSGDVKEKLAYAKKEAAAYPEIDYTVNIEALEKVQPVDLTASEISVRLGATWIPPEIIEQFMFELLETPSYARWNIHVHFSQYNGTWNVEGKSYDRENINAYSIYGTDRINAYKIIEETLNLRDVRIMDYIDDGDGRLRAVLNKRETAIAQSKQELLKQAFKDWIWTDPQRREQLCRLYNDKFNSIRPREYDGSHINFVGMNPEIELRKHQKNAVAHIIYGGNTLLAHCVGAGKTFTMAAAAMELKRLGLCHKSLFIVPNHITGQWEKEFLQLYPAANILVATEKDFERKNRKKFCGRIATGDYDAVIIGHSQFEKIPMSLEHQQEIIQQQLDEVIEGIADSKQNRGDNFSVKQLEKTKKKLLLKLEKLNDQSRKDDVVTFEELGIDRIFVDEAHYYKNLATYTKMRNVGGISQTEAQKSSDLYMKTRYLDKLTKERGTVFATGTPISNSMVELYTMQRYLQNSTLKAHGLSSFDAWASTFGETITAIELTPEGTGYRAKTRFAKFHNVPELMTMFKEVADIQTADMLKLPVPKAHYHNVRVQPSEIQKELVKSLAERADKVRNNMVNSAEDNLLLITNDGRKLALDQRMIDPLLPDYEGSKVNACVKDVYDIWEKTLPQHSAQLIFSDLSTPKADGSFSVYTDIRDKLIKRGVPEKEIRFIHEANTEIKKEALFRQVREGKVRVLIGSTLKMGAGTNVQNKLKALHDLDAPWRPSDLEQRLGRILREGNENDEVDIFRYASEGTFDAYLWQLLEAKQKYTSQIMTSKSPLRTVEDVDETALSYAEIKMLATGNPCIKEKMDLDIQVQKLNVLKANYLNEKYSLEDKILKDYPEQIAAYKTKIAALEVDEKCAESHPRSSPGLFVGMIINNKVLSDKTEAGEAILKACKAMKNSEPVPLGEYRGFKMDLFFSQLDRSFAIRLKGQMSYNVLIGQDVHGNITRIDNTLDSISERVNISKSALENTNKQLATANENVKKPFPLEEELKEKTARLNELNALLNVDKSENEIVDGEQEEVENDEKSVRGRDEECR